MNNKLLKIIIPMVGVVIVVGMGFLVVEKILDTASGEEYTAQKWFAAEQYYCESQGMVAQEYIGQNCGFFSCIDVEKTMCVKGKNERMIDYKDKVFCRYKLAGDYGMC